MTLVAQITQLARTVGAEIKSILPRLLPLGGAAGQVLIKSGPTDGEASWASLSAPTAVLLTIPFPGALEFTTTVSDDRLAGTEYLECWLGPADDSEENDPEMLDLKTFVAKSGAGTVTFTLTFSEITSGPIRVLYRNPAAL